LNLQKVIFNIYFYGVTLSGLTILFVACKNFNPDLLQFYIIWITLTTIIEMRPVSLNTKGQVTLSFALNLAIMMIYGTWFSVITAGISNALVDLIGKRGWKKILFNSTQYSITLFAAGLVYFKFSPSTFDNFTINQHIIPFILAACTYVFVNFLLVSVIVSLSYKIPLLDVIKMDLGMMILFLTSLAPISLLMAILYTNEPWSVVLVLPPLALAHNGFENYLNLRKQARTTFELLADAVDKRDPYTASHSFRVAAYAEKIAEEMGLPFEQKENIAIAGRVHDIGKIGISDTILQKPGKLTEIEYSKMKTHPKTGYEILSPLELYKGALSFVLYHHERMDGKGYPSGLTGQSIPLGARILAVADSFDAMTSNRPYRKAMSDDEAVKELMRNRGTQFDPEVVDAFIRVWKKEKQSGGES